MSMNACSNLSNYISGFVGLESPYSPFLLTDQLTFLICTSEMILIENVNKYSSN